MPFILVALGILLVVVGIRNTVGPLGAQIQKDFTGPGNFFYWIAAIFIIGAIGYVDELKAPTRAMLTLILISLILSNRGFFAKFMDQLNSGTSAPPPPGPPSPQAQSAAGGAVGGASGGGIMGGLGGVLGGLGGTAGGTTGSSTGSPISMPSIFGQ